MSSLPIAAMAPCLFTTRNINCTAWFSSSPSEGSSNFHLFILLLSIPGQWAFWPVRPAVMSVPWICPLHGAPGAPSCSPLSKSYALQRSGCSLTSSINNKDGLRRSSSVPFSTDHLRPTLSNNTGLTRYFLALITIVSWNYENSLITEAEFYTFIALFLPSKVPGPSNCT